MSAKQRHGFAHQQKMHAAQSTLPGKLFSYAVSNAVCFAASTSIKDGFDKSISYGGSALA